MPVRGSGCPLTIFLIAVCILVAVVSRLGNDTRPVSVLFFAEPASALTITELHEELQRMEEAGEEGSAGYERTAERLGELSRPNAQPLAQIGRGQVWRLVTPIFLHFGPIHLLFNMMWLWTLGRVLETHFRSVKFGLLVLATAAVSNLAEAWFKGTNFGGMSGVVYGLFGFVVVRSKLYPTGGLEMNPQTVRFMLLWLVLCFTGLLGPIANWAHSFGLVTGGVIGGVNALLNGGWGQIKRRHEFHRAISSAVESLHECAVCAKTERSDPSLEFRVGADGRDYCEHHLPQ